MILRDEVRRLSRLAPLSAALLLGGCDIGVLDPKGPIADANKTILINSVAIMLAIVVPTILATLAAAWWFRSSNTKATYLPDFEYSGALELIVWAIPLLTIMLLGGVAWIGSHDLDPAVPIESKEDPINIQVVSLDWKWLFIYPDQHVASVNRLVIPAGTPIHFTLTSGSVMTAFFVPQLGSMIYTMNKMGTQLHLLADNPGTFRGLATQLSGDGFADMHFEVVAKTASDFYDWLGQTRGAGDELTPERYIELSKQSVLPEPITFKAVADGFVRQDSRSDVAAGPRADRRDQSGRRRAEGELKMFGKLSWGAIPFDQPIPLFAGAFVVAVMVGVVAYVTIKGWIPYLWEEWITSVDHKRIGIMYVTLAAVMLLRGFVDAIMMRSQQAFAFQSQGYLPPEHYNQIFSAHGTIMIFFVAMPFVIGLMNFVVPLQLGVRDVAFPTLNSVSFWLTATGALLINISLVVGEFSRTGWLPFPPLSELTYSPGVGVDYYLWGVQISGVGTLMTGVNFVTTILKIHAPGMTYMRMPVFCWTALACEPAHRRGVPGSHRDPRDADARPLPRLPLLHQRGRRQHDDVHEPHLGLGPSGGLHPHPAGVWRVLRGRRDLLSQAPVRLPVDGAGDARDLRRLLHGVAAPLLHDGRGRQRQRDLRHRVDGHRGADGREDLQLAVHDVWRPGRLRDADAVVDRLHGDLRHRRPDRRPGRGSAGRFHGAQQPVPGRAFP